ncbi:MAG TPA: MarC family protein [Kiloniellales bacterium]|nr:MarC family protein [Kiloniellales bacterium]
METLGLVDVIVILLITIGPIKAAVIYAGLTTGADPALKRAIALKTVITAGVIILLFVLAGQFLLQVFHITLPALTLAGGLILLLFALHMVIGEEKKGEGAAGAPSISIAVYPLAMPLMATPQGIVAVMMLQAAFPEWKHLAILAVIAVAIMAFNYIVLLYADKIMQKLGPAVLMVIMRVVGLLLAALAMQLLIIALTQLGVLEPQAAAH